MNVSIDEASTNLSTLIAEVERTGVEIVIRRNDVPVAKLVPYRPSTEPRPLGGWGPVVIHDDVDDLPADVAASFAGERP